MQKINSISNWIENHSTEIITNIEQESIDVYVFLQNEFSNSNINKNHLFQFVYRSFYRLDNAGLTTEFKKEYFQILENNRDKTIFDFKSVLQSLSKFPNRKGQNTFQFSFTTKMANTIDNSMPIYDSEVARMFSLTRPYQTDFETKILKSLEQFEQIKKGYESILEQNLLPKTIELFDQTFKNNQLSEMKKMDFIFWSAGKIKLRLSKQLVNQTAGI